MSMHAARFTQADVTRATRAAKRAGAKGVEIKRDGSILIRLDDIPLTQPDLPEANPWDEEVA